MVGMWIFKGIEGGKPCLGVVPSTPAPPIPLNIHILTLERRCEVRCNMSFQFPYVLLMFGLARPSTLRAPPVSREGVQYIIVKVLQWTFEKMFFGTRNMTSWPGYRVICVTVQIALYPGHDVIFPGTGQYFFESVFQQLYNEVLHALILRRGRTPRAWTCKAEH